MVKFTLLMLIHDQPYIMNLNNITQNVSLQKTFTFKRIAATHVFTELLLEKSMIILLKGIVLFSDIWDIWNNNI